MPDDVPIVVVHPIDSDIRLVQIDPGHDPAEEPLLTHAGLACEVTGRIWVAMDGISGVSDKTRQFLTTVGNDLDEDVLNILKQELSTSDPSLLEYPDPLTPPDGSDEDDLDDIPVIPEGLMPSTLENSMEPDGGPELEE